MNCCPHCADAEDFFNSRTARREVRRYRRMGPTASTRLLLDALRAQRSDDRTLLDIGGGVGTIQHELMDTGVSTAVQVDASAAYIDVSRQEARRRGNGDRIEYRHGDFVELASEVAPADIVTLDRVICCYPDMERLVTASAAKARHLYGLVFPRKRLLTRVFLWLGNLFFRLRGSEFRVYVHPPDRVDAVVERCGFRRTRSARTLVWQVVTYARESGT